MMKHNHDYVHRCPECGTAISTIQRVKQIVNLIKPSIRHGYVYLISGGNGLYKIGQTKDLEKRMAAFRTSNPNAQLLKAIKTTDCVYLEKAMHAKYENLMVAGEWFELSPQDAAEFCSTKDLIWD